ncbi:MAG: hypothetical protein KF708_02695 [Pirellulales bacterium]|nr:hypothetical protein [Pirellulales bacterium]
MKDLLKFAKKAADGPLRVVERNYLPNRYLRPSVVNLASTGHLVTAVPELRVWHASSSQ